MKKIKKIMPIVIAFIIGISTTVGATTIFNSKDITYSSDKTSKTNVKDSLDELYSKLGKCPEGYECFELKGIAAKVELGDYISMTPTSTSYTLANELSGCDGTSNTCIQNTINPSELNIWRVIKKNEDGTIEVVSEYVSSEPVFLYGKVGYMNYVGALNTVAAQYTNEKYVVRTRHIGYSYQTEIITNTSKLEQVTAPWPKSTMSNGGSNNSEFVELQEKQGVGDIGYEMDYKLVNKVYGEMIGYTPNNQVAKYWLASRFYNFININYYYFCGRTVNFDGILEFNSLWNYNGGFSNIKREYAIRPILTLKSNIEIIGGNGKNVSTAYRLE